MSFNRDIPAQITGPSYQSRSRPLSSQQTVNWYPQYSELGKDQFVLMPFPGLKALGNAAGRDRGFHRMSEKLYQVKGGSLYEITSTGVHTSKGAIGGESRCIIADDGVNMFIVVPDEYVYQYNSDSDTLGLVTTAAISGAKSVDYFNGQFIYTFDQISTVSKVGNGAETNGQISEESLPDGLVRDFVFDEVIYRCGERSIAAWYNSGVGTPPIDRLQGRVFNVGLAAIHSIEKTDNAFYWLGDDYKIYASQAGVKTVISTDAISNEISRYTVISDAIGNTFTLQGQNFYALTFPNASKTFVYSESLGQQGWFELSSGLKGKAYQATSIISAYNKTICSDVENGNIYTLDIDTYTNNGEPIRRLRATQAIDGSALGKKGRRVQMSKAKFIMESGVGIIATPEGVGENPRIMVEYSDDGGRTWSHGEWPRVGRLGEFTLQVEWFNLGSFYERIVRISTTDPVNYSIYSATIDLRLAGK
jgi:hypothetical protein